MAKTITVLGATGNVGGKLAARLLEKGARVRAVARDAGRGEILLGERRQPHGAVHAHALVAAHLSAR